MPATDALTVYLLLIGLLAVTFLAGMKGIGPIRYVFIAGSVGVAWRAWRVSPGMHTEVLITLFALAPFLRRVVDSHTGYDGSGIMLLGPLLALGLPVGELRNVLVSRKRTIGVYAPYGIMLACLAYGWLLSSFQGHFVESSADTLKTILPMLYAVYLIQRDDDCEEIIQGAARAFLVISPLIGIYGVIQYLNPPEWDRYWMIYSQMKSIGTPEPRQVRVFSTMNSPTSFAMFAACGILIFSFCRRGWLPFVLVMPICVALLLSSVRTAWIVVAVTVAFCSVFNATRGRAMMLTLCLLGAGACVLLLTPFGDVIGDRLATMGGDPAEDGSGHARLREYAYVYSNLDQYLFGSGMGNITHDPKLQNIDGQFVASAVMMGIFVGNIYILCIIWAVGQGLSKIQSNEKPLRLVTAGMVLSYLLVLPLLVVTAGEVSFLFWMFVGALPISRKLATPMGAPRNTFPGSAVAPPHYGAAMGQPHLSVPDGRRSSVAPQT